MSITELIRAVNRPSLRVGAAIAGALVAMGCASAGPRSAFVRTSCPLSADVRGYPVVAHSPSGRFTPAELTTIARAVISRWDPADSLAALPQVRALSRQLSDTHAPSRGDWIPVPGDTATVTLLLGTSSPVRATLAGAAEPTAFQQRARLAAQRVREGLTLLEVSFDSLLPGGEITTVVMRFGSEPGQRDGVARFAVQERALSVNRSTLRVAYPEAARRLAVEASIQLAFIVDARGRVDTSRVRVVSAPYREFVDAAKEALVRGKFTAAMRDCRAIPVVAVQDFHFRLVP